VKNIWKGLIIGGLTGAGAGAVLDLFGRGAQLVEAVGKKAADMAPEAADRVRDAAAVASKKAADMAPEAAERVKTAVSNGVARVQEADVAEHVRKQARELAHKVAVSDQADQTKEALAEAADRGRKVARSARTAAPLRSIG
jgi:gas vesicle protein